MKKLYRYDIPMRYNKVEPVLTFNYAEAKDKQGFRLATIDDLEFAICAGEEPYQEEIKIKEGIVKWTEKWGNGELIDCGYIIRTA